MVTIINYKKRHTETGKEFFVLEVQGGIEMLKSKDTGNFYATARKGFITSTFDEMTCQALIGTQMHGRIDKVESDAYDYVVKETGEIIQLHHRFVYVPEDENLAAKPAVANLLNVESFAKKGALQSAF